MNGLTFVLPLAVGAVCCVVVWLRVLRDRDERRARWGDRMSEEWCEEHRGEGT